MITPQECPRYPLAAPRPAGFWVLFSAILASSMAFIDGMALNVALPALQRDLGATGTELLWIVNAYALLLAALILVGGTLGDHFGRKRVFMIGIALFAAASLAVLPFALLVILLSRWAGAVADRYGPRLPLIVGPAMTGLGFLLLVLPGVTEGPAAYWRSYLPAFVGIGLGMGITVAPLTTAVMASPVAARHAGAASGINNAGGDAVGVCRYVSIDGGDFGRVGVGQRFVGGLVGGGARG